MAEENTITTIFRADISQFSASTQQLNTYVKTVNSEFNQATASMGKWSDNTDGLNAKITQLNKTLEAEKTKLGNLESALADLQKEGKENTKQAQNLQIAINNQKASISKTEKAVEGYENSLKELTDAGVKTREELDKLNREADEFKNKAKEIGGGLLKGMAVGIAGIATACVGAIKGLSSLVENTAELRLEQGRVQTAFEQSGHSAETAQKIYNDFNAVLGDTAKTTEAMQHMAQLSKSQEDLNTLVLAGTGIFATYGNSLPIESLMEASNETARTGELTGALTDAINWAGQSEEAFQKKLDACNSEQERQSLIISTLNSLYGEAGEKYKENNADVIEATRAQNEYNNKMAEIATKIQPIMTDFKLAMIELLGSVLEKLNEVDLAGFISNIAEVMKNAINWFMDNKDLVISAVLGIGSAFLTWKVATIVANCVKAVKALTLATEGQTLAQRILNGVMKANPIGLVATAVGVLVSAFTLLWQKCEGFRNFWKGMWDGIVSGFKGIVNGIISGLNALIRGLNKVSFTIPDWVPLIGGKHFGINIPQIPLMAKGGVIDKPTLAMVGEAGKEAVVPLENNTQWINKLANTLSGKLGNNSVVNYTIENKFEKMETSQIALHKANLELKRIIGG